MEIVKETFDADNFVIAARGRVQANTKQFAGIGKNATKRAASVDNNQTAHTNFQQDFLTSFLEKGCERVRGHGCREWGR
jgi:hypothetical protein